ncbi:hypothetical protein CDL15_Pgr006325 [Punica granatum]|uniref:SIS domain-containing protein n=1 Tax=Punica granatum TaxID=22663 RepID=A0A218WB94_PUNGR|nr:hypothetical protein CDL15_Pgr006325 [Punica granatum]
MPLLLRLHDVLVLFSKSGNTKELLRLVPRTRAKGTFLISITSAKEESLLKGCCNMNVWLPLERELCPFGLTLVMQTVFENTVAIALTGAKNLTMEWRFVLPIILLGGLGRACSSRQDPKIFLIQDCLDCILLLSSGILLL